jgi:hypothetical protein
MPYLIDSDVLIAHRAGLKKVAGLLSSEEGDRVFETIYRGREEGPRPFSLP